MNPKGLASLSAGVVLLLAAPSSALGDGIVTGNARFERIKGRPETGHAQLYESNLFLCPDSGFTLGPSRRLGAPPGEAPRGDGYYSASLPAGTWSLLVNQPLFFIRPKVVPGVVVRDGQTTTQHIDLPIDYSTYFTDTWTPTWEDRWYQTFVATGTSITGVTFRLAGTSADTIEVSIRADNGDADVRNWPRAAPDARATDSVAALADNWVRWPSGVAPTVPGRRYAVRLTGVSGGDLKFAVFNRAKDAQSYASGNAVHKDGRDESYDLNITVFSDNDGTAVLYAKTSVGLGELRDDFYAGRWGQTFRATQGSSLAAVDVWAAGADGNWDLDFTFRVFRDGPGGAQVGPTKTTKAAFQSFGAGLHGVSFNPGEVPLEAGSTYYVEFTSSPGFNPYVNTTSADPYADGTAYQDRSARSADLSMTIVVYTATEPGGTVAGRVTDSSTGGGVPAATVTIADLGRSVQTGADGRYELVSVPGGTYRVDAARAGYAPLSRAGVVVVPEATTTVDLSLEPLPCAASFQSPSFEAGLAGWSRYGDARDRTVDTSGGGWFAGIVALDGSRFHGNEINGCCLEGGLYQPLCAVPGHRYRVTAWSNIYWLNGGADDPDDATSRLGVDPGGAADPQTASVVWSARDRQPVEGTEEWRQLELEVTATGPLMTVFLDFEQRADSGNQWRINCFDLVEIEDLDSEPPELFRRGDCDAGGEVDLGDTVFLLFALFAPEGPPIPCEDACDFNDDGATGVADGLFGLLFLYAGERGPRAPFPACGGDPSGDRLACGAFPPCP
jgi:hypothetical protein